MNDDLKDLWIAAQQLADEAYKAVRDTEAYKVWRPLQDAADKARGEYARYMNEVKDE